MLLSPMFLAEGVSGGDLWGTAVVTALAISIDSLCASATDAIDLKVKRKWVWIFTIALIFGLFHFIMPTIGFSVGQPFIDAIEPYVGWISFAIFAFLGLKGLLDVFLDWHSDRMEAIGEKYHFASASHLKELCDKGLKLKEIKRTLKAQAEAFKEGRVPDGWCGEGEATDSDQMKELGIYLGHLSKWLTKKKLKEILTPSSEEEKARAGMAKTLVTVTVQAFATSLDALIVGFSYVGQVDGYATSLPIFAMFTGVVFLMCSLGGILGKTLGEKSQRIANLVGSIILLGLAVKAVLPI